MLSVLATAGDGATTIQFLGCYADNTTARVMSSLLAARDRSMSTARCRALAAARKLPVFGTQASSCYGGSSVAGVSVYGKFDGQCKIPCPGQPSEECGGTFTAPLLLTSVFSLTYS